MVVLAACAVVVSAVTVDAASLVPAAVSTVVAAPPAPAPSPVAVPPVAVLAVVAKGSVDVWCGDRCGYCYCHRNYRSGQPHGQPW